MQTHMESLHLPRLDLGLFKNSSRYLERVGKPTIPFQPPVWAAPHKPLAIALVDVFKANEVITSINVDSKACFLFGRNALVCDIVLEHCSISRMHAALVHHVDGAMYLIDLGSCHGTFMDGEKLEPLRPTLLSHGTHLRFGVSSRTYRFKSYESRQQIEHRVQTTIGLQPDERELQTNTLLNRFLSYRLDAPFCHPSIPTNPWPHNSNRIASHSMDTSEDAQEEDNDVTNGSVSAVPSAADDDMVVSECDPAGLPTTVGPHHGTAASFAQSRKRTRPTSAAPATDHVFLTYDNKRVHFVESPQIIHHYHHTDEDDDVMDVTMDGFDVQHRRASFDDAVNGAATPSQTKFMLQHLGSETTRCGASVGAALGFPMEGLHQRPSIDTSNRIPGARRHTLG
ncbi:hypothetical protein H310_09879 [Aphanomyces invadans]|uniref:FHA domain-containing protein n=1 Tax=Aphanomyces invadans TaxID=157072 RepID=A0A024TSB8_9STRA|nr:hypothetical protein H310_09879 [Aphanomyces invadans]ETV97050.1 hypothetical protein H310_09879 [Aphanomyces invadans]|eukprot:XP_008874296.1 hypothetical protein H310_09879 [Aphanomyces invadans]